MIIENGIFKNLKCLGAECIHIFTFLLPYKYLILFNMMILIITDQSTYM